MWEKQIWKPFNDGYEYIKLYFNEISIDIKSCFPETNYKIQDCWGYVEISVYRSEKKYLFTFELPQDNWLFNYVSPKWETNCRFNHHTNFKKAMFNRHDNNKTVVYTLDHQSSPAEELKKIITFCLCMKHHVKYLPKFIRINIIDMYLN
jgi:hypothetical protein